MLSAHIITVFVRGKNSLHYSRSGGSDFPNGQLLVHLRHIIIDDNEYLFVTVKSAVGDEIIVKVLPKDDQDRLNFSRRDALIEVEGLVPENTVEPRAPRKDFKGPRGGRGGRNFRKDN